MIEVLGLGEWLWDMLPDGPRPGGAPYNLAFQSNAMGHKSGIASRVGDDHWGRDLANLAANANIDLFCAQVDPRFGVNLRDGISDQFVDHFAMGTDRTPEREQLATEFMDA